MGLFTVPIRVRNGQNRFLPENQRGEDLTIDALVDSAAIELCLPAEAIQRLRLEEMDTMSAQTADGARHRLRVFGMAEIDVQADEHECRSSSCRPGHRRCSA